MVMEEKRNIKPLLLKFGVALALSFAGFIYARFKSRNIKPSLPPTSPSSSDHGNKVDLGRGRTRSKYNIQATKTTSSSSLVLIADDGHEEICTPKISVDGSVVGLSPSSKHSGDKDGILLPEFHDLVKELDFAIVNTGFSPKKEAKTPRSHVETPKAFVSVEKVEYEHEIRHLRNVVRMLRERERILEVQLLEYYGLKEQETAVMELQNRLKINCMESKLFVLKIESLQADNRRLEAQVLDHAKVVSDLEAARTKIKLLKKKLSSEAEQNKELILNLQKRVVNLQEEYKSGDHFPDFQMKMRRLKDLEGEVEELRKSNTRLQLENSDLGQRLEATQLLANSVLEDSEAEASKEEGERLRQENEDLTTKIERLQSDRCTDVEELVYLRWINACLRYELRNYQPPAGKTVARDLSKTLSPKSEEKAKQLILEYANTEGIVGKKINITDFDSDQWSSSQASYLTDSGEGDDTSVDLSSASKANNTNKTKFIGKLRRLIWGKDIHHHGHHGHGNGQTLPAEKSGSLEDIESLHCSSTISVRTEATAEGTSSLRFRTPSQISSRSSLDLLRSSSQTEENRKCSDRSSSTSKRFVLGRQGSCDLAMVSSCADPAMADSEKFELMKYAEVFKDSRGGKSKSHKKSASFRSF